MMKNWRAAYAALIAITILILAATSVYGQRRSGAAPLTTDQPQPLFSEYRGIRLGMTATEVRAKLGEPTLKADDQDYYYNLSPIESAQFAYDKSQKVVAISIDYSGTGAPDYRSVIGPAIDQKEDGSLYKMVRYEAQGFWVSYNRTAGTPPIVTITIQKI